MDETNEFVLICTIVQEEYGSKVLKIGRNNNFSGGTVTKGKGSIQSKFLNLLGLSDARKEICLHVLKKHKEEKFYQILNDELQFDKPHHGLVFSLPVVSVIGLRNHQSLLLNERKDKMGVDSIFIIVDKGKSEDVIASAKKAGATGGTVMNARGSGVHKTEKLFNFEIEPEKEVIFILSNKKETNTIVNALNNDFDLEHPGNGILFVLDVSKSMGLVTKN